MSQQPPVDDARDAHLLAALRHAPDRDVRPPAQVTAAILGQAKQAVGSSPMGRSTWHDGLRAALHRLWQPAPMAAFGTLAMATLIGVMWGTQNLPDATPSLRPEVAAAPQADETVAAEAAAPPPLAKAAQPDAGARETVVVAPRSTTARPMPTPMSKATPVAKPVDTAAAQSPAAATERRDALQESEARRNAAVAVATPPAATSPAPPSVALAPAPAVAMPRAVPLQGDVRAKSLADAVSAPTPARARSEMAPAALGATAPAAASPLTPAAAEIDAAMSNDAGRVRWRITAQRLVAHDAARRDWWAALARATQGRWQLAATSSASGAESAPLALLIDGAPRGSLAFEPLAVVWRDANGVAWRAPIAAATLREWQEAVARW